MRIAEDTLPMSTPSFPNTQFHQNWLLRKPEASGDKGVVACQHRAAAEIGAEVLRDGGNAVDAAIAVSFAISVVEPWMSGMGGGGYMQVALAKKGTFRCINMGMVAPKGLRLEDYPLDTAGGVSGDLFAWPNVLENRNIVGYHSIAVPGLVAGMAFAHARYGSKPWAELLWPAIALAKRGLPVTWYMSLRTLGAARELRRFLASQETYLPGGLPPTAEQGKPIPHLPLGKLPDTLGRIAEAGAEDFYKGDIAKQILRDARAGGSRLSAEDLTRYAASEAPPIERPFGAGTLHAAPGLTAGPTLLRTAELAEGKAKGKGAPDAALFAAWAKALAQAYDERFRTMGDTDDRRDPACTSNFTVADKDGNMVCVTQTLLSVFGSKVVFPGTGILMNNGIMWFDPRPGGPNALAPGKRPLSNMCPTIVSRDGKPWFAIGASGGRRIMPAVFQVAAMLALRGMAPEDAYYQPRIDVSGEGRCTVDPMLDPQVAAAIEPHMPVIPGENAVYPHHYACPNLVLRDPETRRFHGFAHPMTPPSGAVAV
jgi:gamma-glutamyltranspeptidase/glutathione hydrolase